MHWGTYIACGIPLGFAEYLMEQVKEQIGDLGKYIAWHESTYLHMTIHFLGWINDWQTDIIKRELDNLEVSAFVLPNVMSLGWNENEKYLVVKIEKTPELEAVHGIIVERLEKHNIFVKTQDFIPHISLGRIAFNKSKEFQNLKLQISTEILKDLKVTLYESISHSIVL